MGFFPQVRSRAYYTNFEERILYLSLRNFLSLCPCWQKNLCLFLFILGVKLCPVFFLFSPAIKEIIQCGMMFIVCVNPVAQAG